MECPHCKKHIKSTRNQCNYCNMKINKALCSRFWNILESFITNEKQFIESIKAGNIPIIKSVEEIELYLEHKIKDEEIAVIVADVLQHIGEDGVMEIKKGCNGNPYRVEYFSNDLPPNISRKEADKQIDKLRSELKNYSYQKENESAFLKK